MFKRLHEPDHPITILVDGLTVTVAPGDSVSTALLCAGKVAIRRTSVSGSARGTYCGMGVCFDCLVTIDGEGNRQACLTVATEGMTVTTGSGRRRLLAEVS
jgi:predicted molibdopterin-dependent oxidoreductase YjgC